MDIDRGLILEWLSSTSGSGLVLAGILENSSSTQPRLLRAESFIGRHGMDSVGIVAISDCLRLVADWIRAFAEPALLTRGAQGQSIGKT